MVPGTEMAAISPAGRLAGRTISVLLVLTGPAFIAAAWPELWLHCPTGGEPCVHRAAAAGLTTMVALIVIGVGVAIWLNVRGRPMSDEGPNGYRWGFGALFAGGLVLATKQIPSWTCALGRFDELLRTCVTPSTRTEPSGWLPLKAGLVALALAGGAAIGLLRRRVRLSAVVAAISWIAGVGWLLDAAFVRG